MHDDPIQSLIHLHEDGAFNRRELIERLVKYTGSLAAATAAVEQAGLLHAQTQACPADVKVPENAPDIDPSSVTLHGEGGPIYCYMVLPKVALPRPAVLVIHENRGLNEHIKDVTRRVARAGFVALGVDLLSRQGGTDQFPDPVAAGQAYNRTTAAAKRQDLISCLLTLKDQSYVQGDRLGSVGFCAGGTDCIDLALNSPDLSAAAVFYGGVPNPADSLQNMSGNLLAIYGEQDTNTNSGLPRLLTALLQYRKGYEMHVYQGARHAFHNDTGAAYNSAAACDAWSKTIAFFGRHLDAPRA
ncbi:MAG: dienelactone hydrolase family protein [Acidobacteriia bacterium]|nr:dienelactone hydrolase family protein [Terriglobia bacterium]